ncbi:hypothetical protein DID88_001864 [Monilinia fructigena]|uniref:ribonuclease H n=1 Tax=Monilinia fructigena TaxID=38457 RepID=A0A395IXB8_9HELO|nr:hypothetical protein DID88_001864 [Monilinia fructigena]
MVFKHRGKDTTYIYTDASSTEKGIGIGIIQDRPTKIKTIKAAEVIKAKGAEISLNWVPGHTSVEGNELADKLAKEATTIRPILNETSFGLLGGTAPWPEANVTSLLNTYKASSAYYKYLGKPFVSTFEGVDNSADWTAIKAQTGCFFVPNWSSLGPQEAVARGTADGLFSWNARWQEILSIDPQPEWVEIITWNDYGEFHYIGPLHEEEYPTILDSIHGNASYNFANNMAHDAFACSDGYTTGNAASQLQIEFYPTHVVQDKIFYSALLAEAGTVTVTVGGIDLGFQAGSTVTATPALNISEQVCTAGFGYTACTCTNYGPQPTLPTAANTPGFGTIGYPARGLTSESGACGTVDYGVVAETTSPFLPPACVSGTGVGNLDGLCGYACPYGYCPIHSCTCTLEGVLNPPLPITSEAGTAVPGEDPELYDGLCNFACSRGYCPSGACEYADSNGVFEGVRNGTVNGVVKNGNGTIVGDLRVGNGTNKMR